MEKSKVDTKKLLADVNERAMNGDDTAFNKLIDDWNADVDSGKAKRNYNKFIKDTWNPLVQEIKKKKEKKESTKQLMAKYNSLKSEKDELFMRQSMADLQWIIDNIDWA